jgi:hypothetical protein
VDCNLATSRAVQDQVPGPCHPVLCYADWVTGDTTAAPFSTATVTPVADDVEDLQVAYGIDFYDTTAGTGTLASPAPTRTDSTTHLPLSYPSDGSISRTYLTGTGGFTTIVTAAQGATGPGLDPSEDASDVGKDEWVGNFAGEIASGTFDQASDLSRLNAIEPRSPRASQGNDCDAGLGRGVRLAAHGQHFSHRQPADVGNGLSLPPAAHDGAGESSELQPPMRRVMRAAARRRAKREEGAALILAILTMLILTILGIGLLFTTTTEFQIAGAETTVNRTFYAADSGSQYGILQAKFDNQTNTAPTACTVGGIGGYWCFSVPEQNPGVTQRNLAVTVSPMRLVDIQLAPSTQLNVGTVPLYNVGLHFSSNATDTLPSTTTVFSQKQILVDVVVGPMPFILPNH